MRGKGVGGGESFFLWETQTPPSSLNRLLVGTSFRHWKETYSSQSHWGSLRDPVRVSSTKTWSEVLKTSMEYPNEVTGRFSDDFSSYFLHFGFPVFFPFLHCHLVIKDVQKLFSLYCTIHVGPVSHGRVSEGRPEQAPKVSDLTTSSSWVLVDRRPKTHSKRDTVHRTLYTVHLPSTLERRSPVSHTTPTRTRI